MFCVEKTVVGEYVKEGDITINPETSVQFDPALPDIKNFNQLAKDDELNFYGSKTFSLNIRNKDRLAITLFTESKSRRTYTGMNCLEIIPSPVLNDCLIYQR